uniref:Uncharacterized protein n=1 Tax=Setaria viridis TaxID=4556 RepID=A0A4V6D773_SETVI|nr:hypothetical protein SEVIR_5G349000v2 [Setaria viridis]
MRSCSSLVICCGVPRAAAVEGARHRLLPQSRCVRRPRHCIALPFPHHRVWISINSKSLTVNCYRY